MRVGLTQRRCNQITGAADALFHKRINAILWALPVSAREDPKSPQLDRLNADRLTFISRVARLTGRSKTLAQALNQWPPLLGLLPPALLELHEHPPLDTSGEGAGARYRIPHRHAQAALTEDELTDMTRVIVEAKLFKAIGS